MNKNIFRPGYEKPLHYPCTVLMKAKPGCSYDKRLYCDIFSLYYKCEKEWDIGDLKDKIEWWCYATDLERYIKQTQKDLEIAREALEEIKKVCDSCRWCESNIYTLDNHDGRIIAEITNEALKLTEHKE